MSEIPPPSDSPSRPKRATKPAAKAGPAAPARKSAVATKTASATLPMTSASSSQARTVPDRSAQSATVPAKASHSPLSEVRSAKPATKRLAPNKSAARADPDSARNDADAAPPPWAETTRVDPALPSATKKGVGKKLTKTTPVHPADASTRSMRVIQWLTSGLRDPWRERIREYLVLMRMDRPVGALLLLWPTLWGLWFAANDFPPIGALIIFTFGVFVMRAAGCVINDYADHDWLDGEVERTRDRPMAAGRVSKKEALLLFGGLLAVAFVLVLLTNALTIKLAFAGAALAAVYPFCKRYTHLAQIVLGAAFGWSIPMAFAAVTGEVPALGWLLFLANVLFSTIYDTEYAMVDREDDIRVGAKSTAILFADADRPILGILMLTFLFAMLLCGTRAELDWPYFVGLGIAAGLFAWQQWLIRKRERDACFAAFRNNNGVGFVLWVGLLLALAIR